MRLSKTKLYKMQRIEKGEKLSTSELLERSGYIHQVQSGLFVQMHMMKRVINNLEGIVRRELDSVSCLEIGLNQVQSADLWKQTGRYDTYGSEMFKLKDRQGKEMVFTGTNEELVTYAAKTYVESYKDLSFTFYQINNKFRDEIRCNTGLIRSKEFLMMDAYSFHEDQESLASQYAVMRTSYENILTRLGLKYRIESADSGEIGGSFSEEFVVETSEGDVEIGHIFQLGTKYSESMDLQYVDRTGSKQHVHMGCYGIGISRLAQVLADVNRTDNSFNWGKGVSAYDSVIVVADVRNEDQMTLADRMYKALLVKGESVYLDDRDVRMGQKLTEADVIGTTNKLLVGRKAKENIYEVKINGNWEERNNGTN